MITLQASPLIEWDETNTNFFTQSDEAQKWVDSNILTTQNVTVDETVVSSNNISWDRPNTLTYTIDGFQLVIDLNYQNNDSSLGAGNTYTLTEI